MIDLVVRHIIPTTMALLPSAMDTPRARAQMVAVGLQESKFLERQQVLKTGARTGPARGLWQFERAGGTRGVMTHDRSRALAERVLVELRYKHLVGNFREVHYTLRDNDVLACAFARLLLWTLPWPLPPRNNPAVAWQQYLEGWRPGDPHPSTWDTNYKEAWQRVELAWKDDGLREWRE